MREIKFRAWEKNLKEIIPIHNIDFETKMINTELAWRRFDEIEIMQYTGIKDKNGKQIYEGDIVKHFQENWVGKVIFSDGAFRVIAHREWILSRGRTERLEVIGNIYENPDLLDGDKS